jgi:hypothetical protein
MVLLDDFGDIVLKTPISVRKDDCTLKNALVNLGNSKDWDAGKARERGQTGWRERAAASGSAVAG